MRLGTVAAACALVGTLLPATAAAGTLTWQASGGLLPEQTDSRWYLANGSSLGAPVLAGGVLTLQTSAYTAEYSYYQVLEADIRPPSSGPSWLEVQTRLVGGGGTAGWWRAPIFLGISFASGTSATLEIGADEAWLRNDNNSLGTYLSGIDTNDSLHTWRLEADGPAIGSTVRAYYDNTLVMSGPLVYPTPGGGSATLFWGEASVLAWGASEWASVSTNLVSGVPEPASALMLAAGLAAGLAARLGQRACSRNDWKQSRAQA